MQDPTLLLRDIHQPPAPPFWPPAPGWWLLAGAVLLVLGIVMGLRWKRARRREIAAIFDNALDEAATPTAEVAAISQLLRRAARRIDPEADRLQGDAWLAFLDRPAGNTRRSRKASATDGGFGGAPGRLLLEGAFRPEVDPADVATLRSLARARFQQWMLDQ